MLFPLAHAHVPMSNLMAGCVVLKEHAENHNDLERVGPVCNLHHDRIIRADKRNRNIKKLKSKKRVATCWVNPMEIAVHDVDNTDDLRSVTEETENMCIRYHDSRVATQSDVTYSRSAPESPWRLVKSLARDATLSVSVHIVPEDYVPPTPYQNSNAFPRAFVATSDKSHKVLGNLVLFKRIICKNRLLAFHPDHQPSEQLTMTKTYPNAVAGWHTSPSSAHNTCSQRNISASRGTSYQRRERCGLERDRNFRLPNYDGSFVDCPTWQAPSIIA